MYLALSCPKHLQWALAVDTWVLPSSLHPLFGYHLLPLCLLQGSSDSVSEKAPIPAFGGVVHYSDCHRPAAPLATCPSDQLSVSVSRPGHSPACLFAKIPCQPLPISGPGLLPPGSPAPDHPICYVSGSFVILFCLQRQELGKGVLGTGDSETGETERVVRWGAEAGSRAAPGKGQCCILEVAGTTTEFSGSGGSTFPEAKMCSSSKLP